MSVTGQDQRLRRGLSLAAALVLAFLSFGLEIHHHEDGDSHYDCSVCTVLHQAQAASLHSKVANASVLPVISDCSKRSEERPSPSVPFRIPYIRPPPTHQ